MIVVVIIGILAAVAIPSYQGFQKRAKSAEAKSLLAAIYTGEAAFKAEHEAYSDNLQKIGIDISQTFKYYKAVGFAGTKGVNTIGESVATGCTVGEAVAAVEADPGPPAIPASPASPISFKACAQIATTFDAVTDWVIDQNKVLGQTAP